MKKLIVVLVSLLLSYPALAGQTPDGRLYVATDHPNRFTCSLTGLAATLTQCQAAPAAGLRLYVTDVVVQTTTATSGQFSIQSGTGTNCGTATTAVMPSGNVANRFNAPPNTAGALSVDLDTPLALTAGHALCVIGTVTNTVSIQIVGYTAP